MSASSQQNRFKPVSKKQHGNEKSPTDGNSIPKSATEQCPEKSVTIFCTQVCNNVKGKSFSKTLLVELRAPDQSSTTLCCYAILDDQSTTTFAVPEGFDFFSLQAPSDGLQMSPPSMAIKHIARARSMMDSQSRE